MSLLRLGFVTVTLCVSCGGSSFQSASGGDSGAGGGGTAAGGSASGGSASGGSAAGGGSPSGGVAGAATGGAGGSSSGAGGGASECERLRTEYGLALEKARGCDSGSTDQCSTSSTLPSPGCGCPVLVNTKSEFSNLAKQKYQAFQNAMCDAGPVCEIACLEPISATCAPQMTAAGTVYQCAGAIPATH